MTTAPTSLTGRFTYVAGAAQQSIHGDVAPHPAELMVSIARSALADAGINDVGDIDAIACVETVSWSYDDLVGVVSAGLGCRGDVRRLAWRPDETLPEDFYAA